ncbi:MAG: SAM-dependent methyltransferase [Phycisphaerales bacterium]
MLRLFRRAISKYVTIPRREQHIERMNLKNMGYYLASIQRDRATRVVPGSPRKVELKSKGCTQRDVESDWATFWCSELACGAIYHRKVWELCYVSQALFTHGKLAPGNDGLVFGCGEEPLPSLFAKYGAKILATDLDPSNSGSSEWIETGQHTTSVERLRMPKICPDPELRKNIDLRYVDMNNIPADLDGKFDFCWSTCSLEHLGSIENGLRFIEQSLKTLKPGGVAVHTTEWNMNDEGKTVDNAQTVLFQKKHLMDVIERIRRKGFIVAEPDFTLGEGMFDGITDLPPYGSHGPDVLHLRIALSGYRCTSWGLIVQRPK